MPTTISHCRARVRHPGPVCYTKHTADALTPLGMVTTQNGSPHTHRHYFPYSSHIKAESPSNLSPVWCRGLGCLLIHSLLLEEWGQRICAATERFWIESDKECVCVVSSKNLLRIMWIAALCKLVAQMCCTVRCKSIISPICTSCFMKFNQMSKMQSRNIKRLCGWKTI